MTFNPRLHLVDSFEEAGRFKRWFSERASRGTPLGVDTETGGLEWWKQPTRLVQVGDLEDGWAIPFEDGWPALVKEVLNGYDDSEVVMHNAKFDCHFLMNAGIHIPPHVLHDTMIMSHLIDPETSNSLKSVSAREVSPLAASAQSVLGDAMKEQKWGWDTVPTDFGPYWQYGALDPVLTAQVFSRYREKILRDFSQIYDIEMGVLQVLLGMERRGSLVDLDYCDTKLRQLQEYAADLEERALNEFGVKNVNSTDQLSRALQLSGVELTERTPSGRWSMGEDVLKKIEHPLAQIALNVRKSKKLAGSYFSNFLSMHNNGFLHAGIRQVGARTGRMSVTEPALQTLPRGPVVRNAFIPRSEENKLVLADFDQMELRVFAHFADEEGMIKAVHEGVDLHDYVCRILYDIPEEESVKGTKERDVTKGVNFAKVYVAGAQTFADTAGIPLDEAKGILARYDREFPRVRQFQQEVGRLAQTRAADAEDGRAYVTTPFGRRHPCDPNAAYKLVNYLVQGTCADILKVKLIELSNAGLDDFMLLPVHDEVVFDVPDAEVDDVRHTIEETMSENQRFRVPLSVGVDVVNRWGAKYE